MPKKNTVNNHKVTYKKSGVSIENADKLISMIKPIVKKTHDNNVIGNIGGFGALYDISKIKFKKPILVSGTDGVGTKLKLAIKLKKLNSIGIDLVAMCVNDIISQGAKPLFFLDYYATGKLNAKKGYEIITGIVKGCKQSKISLIGGETAEMPKLYKNEDFDLAGFCVGIAEKENLLPKGNIRNGDYIIGLSSNGLHSNGYSLVNHMIEKRKIKINDKINQQNIGNLLINPTKIYTEILNIKSFNKIKAIANITGGGLTENIPRILPKNKSGLIDFKCIRMPKIFSYIQNKGNIENEEMLKVLNCGIGMIIICNAEESSLIMSQLKRKKIKSSIIGEIIKSNGKPLIKYKNI